MRTSKAQPGPDAGGSAPPSLVRPVDLRRLSRLLRDRALTCTQATLDCLDRAERTEPAVRAYLHVARESALEQAAALDAELAAGRWRGPLHGIPMAVKDVIDVAGMPTTAGSRVVDRALAGPDAAIVAALRDAGVIWLGKANTHEFANGATTPPTRNPWDPARIAGGSSGGSCAAVAAGSAVAALGTDTGGSVRVPAALCGMAGLRPRSSPGLPGMEGIVALAPEFDQWGIVAAGAAGVALIWSVLSGAAADTFPRRLRIGVPARCQHSIPALDAAVGACFATAIHRLEAAGDASVAVPLGRLDDWYVPRQVVQMHQALQVHRQAGWWPARRDLYTEDVRANLESAECEGSGAEPDARARMRGLDGALDDLLADVDVLAVPTVPVPAPLAREIAAKPRGRTRRHAVVGLLAGATLPFSRADLASMTVRAGLVDGRLPAGIQIIGRTESVVFEAALRIEAHDNPEGAGG
jgi:aspartyl-tRNA(Asn)/glutamyl-tRNA(Gln) amidotransferase subunit A